MSSDVPSPPGREVTVVVPTTGRVRLLERCLDGLARQEDVTAEVVVVHDGQAEVEALLDRYRGRLDLRPIVSPERGAAVKRNLGWRAARADTVAFTDDDCEPAPRWLRTGLDSFESGVDLVQGRVLPHPADDGVTGVFARTLRVEEHTPTYPNANLLYTRAALERVGGYDPAFWGGGEDTDLAWRVLESGGDVRFAPDALVWHAIRPVGFLDHLRSLPRWSTLALALRRHPGLRRLTYRRWFWKPTHPTAVLALAGLVVALGDWRGLVLALPHLVRRVKGSGLSSGVQLAVADVVEVVVVVVGSVRYRTVLL